MSDYIATEVRPAKNAYGLPTGEGGFDTEPLESSEEVEAVEEVQEPIGGVEEEVVPEVEAQSEEEEEEDILKYLADEPEETVSEESEMDRLRRELAVLQGHLEEQRQLLDGRIKEEADTTVEEDTDIDLKNPQFRKAIQERLEEDPSLVFPLMEEIMDRKFKTISKKLEARERVEQETEVSIEQQNRLKESLYKGLSAASELGEVEKRIVEQVQEAVASRDPSRSVLLVELEKHPELANSPEGIEATVVRLARRAELRARNKGVEIASGSKPTASDRSNRMMKKQTQPSEEVDPVEETFKRLMATRKGNLDKLLKGR